MPKPRLECQRFQSPAAAALSYSGQVDTFRAVLLLLFAAGAFAAAPALPNVHWVDVAAAAGLTQVVNFGDSAKSSFILESTGVGVALLDYDGDRDLDIFIPNGVTLMEARSGGGSPSRLYRNEGGLRFDEVGREAGFDRVGWAQGACAGDVDNDGDVDLFVAYHGPDAFYRNRGGGRFREEAAKAGLDGGDAWSAGCAFLDYDRDGRLDLFVSRYVDLAFDDMPEPGSSPNCYWKKIPVFCGPRSLPKSTNALYRNRGGGKFEDVSAEAGILAPGGRYGLGVVAADFDNDGWTDLYVACDQTPSLLYRNRGDGTFEERGIEAGVAYNFDGVEQAGMGVAVADYDGNGYLDIVKTNFEGDLPSLYINEDGQFFEDLALEAGLGANKLLGWGVLFVDADQDARPDILMAHGHIYPEVDDYDIGESYLEKTVFYRNAGDGRFADRTADAGPALETPRPARGMAAGDLDGDGKPEVVIANLHQPPSLLRNGSWSGSWLWLQLEGRESNRSAIGARVEVEADGRRQIQDVVGGGSYLSQNEFGLHFGLGEAERINRLTVKWPSGREDSFADLPSNVRYRLVEGAEPTASP